MLFNNKLGLYNILGAFFFIIIFIVGVFGILFYENILFEVKSGFSNELYSLKISKEIRERAFFCYGSIIDTKKINLKNSSCGIKNTNFGFEIVRLNESGCTYYSKYFGKKRLNSSFDFKLIYDIPIKEGVNSSLICLGELRIYK